MKLAVLIVKLPEVINSFFSNVDLSCYNIRRPVFFPPTHMLSRFFHPSEQDKINSFKTFKRQIEWIGGRLAIKKLYQQIVDPRLPANEILVGVNENGAPFLPFSPSFSVSISHSHYYAMGALSCQPGIKVGIDIEMISEMLTDEFYQIAFSGREIRNLYRGSAVDTFLAWTGKEAFLKYMELGFRENLKKVEIIGNKIFYHGLPRDNLSIISGVLDKNYVYSLVTNRSAEEIRPQVEILNAAELKNANFTAVA